MGTTGLEGTGTHAEIDAYVMEPSAPGVTYTDCRLVNFNTHYHVRRENGVPVYIVVSLISRNRASKVKQARGEWGADGAWYVKVIDETMGPVEDTCPLDLFDICPLPEGSEWAREWRERVKAYHARRASLKALPLELGSRIRLKPNLKIGTEDVGGMCATVIGFRGRQNAPLVHLDEGLYALASIGVPRKLIAEILPAEEAS